MSRSDRFATRVGLSLIALAAIALVGVAFGFHPVGDYFTESDFYGGYVTGARGILHGQFDFGRYGIYGPLYELVLAAVGGVLRDMFVAARAISVVSALGVLASSWWWARRRFGAAAAAWLVALLAVNPTFVRYGYSASTDMLSFGCFALALALLLGHCGTPAAIIGGAVAGLAALTRYNLASLVPGALLVWLARRPWPSGVRAAAGFALGFAVVVGAFAIPAARSGHIPGAMLFREARWYLEDAPAMRLEERYGPVNPSPATPAPPELAERLASRTLTGLATHARDDARLLLGWPVAGLVLSGLVWLIATRATGPLGALAPPFVTVFVALAPVFYSERYSMVLMVFEMVPAALALGLATGRKGARRVLALAAGTAALLASAHVCMQLQRLEYQSIPVESLAAGRAICAEARPGDRVLTRKPQVAFTAGIEPVMFPDAGTLEELGALCRRERVRYLYYSWYELRLRPRFGYLLDTAAVVPGLTPINATANKPSATYRVGPEFGVTPAWWRDAGAREAIRARVNALIAPAMTAPPP